MHSHMAQEPNLEMLHWEADLSEFKQFMATNLRIPIYSQVEYELYNFHLNSLKSQITNERILLRFRIKWPSCWTNGIVDKIGLFSC